MEETNITGPQGESVATRPSAPSPKPVRATLSGQSPPTASPKVVKEAEHKLKEMSRKAKERKTSQNASKQKALSEVNYFWLVIGGLGALGVGYLVFGKKEETPKPRQRFKGQRPVAYAYVPPPKPKTPEGSVLTPKAKKVPVKEEVIEKQDSVKFELNCF